MRVHYTESFLKSYASAPKEIKKALDKQALDKQVSFLLLDLRHKSLQAKKYKGYQGVWQARVTKSWRFYFSIQGDTYHLVNIMSHPK